MVPANASGGFCGVGPRSSERASSSLYSVDERRDLQLQVFYEAGERGGICGDLSHRLLGIRFGEVAKLALDLTGPGHPRNRCDSHVL